MDIIAKLSQEHSVNAREQLRTGSPHRLLCITYYVLCIMHYALGVHIVYYVLRTTYYVLCITHWESTSYVMYYVLFIVYDASYIAHFRQAHHVCVLTATFYVLERAHAHIMKIYSDSIHLPESVVTSAHTTLANLWQPETWFVDLPHLS